MAKSSPMRLADDALKALRPLTHPSVRRDYASAARIAMRAIGALMGARNDSAIRSRMIAMEIADKAAQRPTLVYRVKKTGAIRWQRADRPSAVRLSPDQIIGTFDHGANWRDILENLR